MQHDPYAIHDTTKQTIIRFDSRGKVSSISRITYYVGAHGPFFLEYPKDKATSDQINNDMLAEVQQLRMLQGTSGSATPGS